MIIKASEFGMLAPEIFVLSMACIILVLDLFLSDRERFITYWFNAADTGFCSSHYP